MKKTYWIVFFIACFSRLLVGAEPVFYFSSLKLEEGLSQLSVINIHQDYKGFMWFATRNGLNRFDGTSFTVYKHSNKDSMSLSNNYVTSLAEDIRGYLWIGTTGGLNRLDLKTDRMIAYNGLSSFSGSPVDGAWISDVYVDSRQRLWVAMSKGLYQYNYEEDIFQPVSLEGELDRTYIMRIKEDRKGNLLVGTLNKGLYICDAELNLVDHYLKDNTTGSLTDNLVSAIYEDSTGQLWIGTRESGLNKIDRDTHTVACYTTENSTLGNNYIRTIEEYNGYVIVGTFNGLTLIDLKDNSFQKYNDFDTRKGGLSHFSIYSTYVDNANTIWIGTYAGGVNYSNPLNSRFIFHGLKNEQEQFPGVCGAMAYQPETNILWIASEGRGLLAYDIDKDSFSHYLLDNHSDLLGDRNIIKSLYIEGNTIWCGTQKGTVYRFDTRTKKFSLFHTFDKILSVYTIDRCSDGALWMGTTDNNGIVRFLPDERMAPKDTIFGHFPSLRSFLEIRNGVYLVGMHVGGLGLYDSNIRKVERYNTRQTGSRHLYDNHVTSIIRDMEGRIWVGTYGGGLCLFDEEKGITDWLTTEDGLSDDNINSVIAGDDGKIWLSTSKGISSFDPDTRSFTNYSSQSEIPVNEFSIKGGIRLPDGRICFSGDNGFISFYPDKLEKNSFVPPVSFTSLTVNNKLITPDDQSGILGEVVDYTSGIKLKYNQNNFSIGYTALNYLYPNQNQYAYKLEGYDKDWNEVGTRKEAFYTNIRPGEYIFRVRASNNDGVWNEEGRSVPVHILTPLWQTWYAYLFYLLISGILIYTIYYYLHMKRKLEHDLIEKQKEQQRQEEFHQSRIRMFTNFSHELRTPLTLILSPLEEVLQRVDMASSLKDVLRLVYANSQRLLLLVNQLMDLRKNQSGNLRLRVSRNDLYLFTQEIYIAFNQIAVKEHIRFNFESALSGIEAWFDRALLEKVVFNLLSNAFKHTSPGESVTVRLESFTQAELNEYYPGRVEAGLSVSSRYACLSIEDTGKGISDIDKDHIFAPFYQSADEQELNTTGTGIGLSLVLSVVKLHKGIVWVKDNTPKGAIFRVLLPIDKDTYEEEQIAEEETESLPEQEELPDISVSDLRKRYTVLLAEDNDEVRRYIRERLERHFDVLEADNGEDAFGKITEVMPDLVVSDIMMPKMDGLQLCSLVKQDLRTGHIPVIIITAKSMVMHIKEGFQSGADDYIVKPFNMEILISRICNLLSSRERLKELYGKKFSLESLGIETTSADEIFMQKFFGVIEQNISNPEFNIEMLCNGIGMGRANLYRKLKAITNLSPIDLIRNKRMEVAAKMFLETEMNVSEVAVSVGFNSHAYFATCFKNVYGISPTEYVQRNKSVSDKE